MNELVYDIEQAIWDLTCKAALLSSSEHSPHEPDHQPGWWVLAVGGELLEESLTMRDKARERLRLEILRADIQLKELVWVWDTSNRAQLVLRTFQEKQTAQAYAAALERKGLHVRVAREWPPDEA